MEQAQHATTATLLASDPTSQRSVGRNQHVDGYRMVACSGFILPHLLVKSPESMRAGLSPFPSEGGMSKSDRSDMWKLPSQGRNHRLSIHDSTLILPRPTGGCLSGIEPPAAHDNPLQSEERGTVAGSEQHRHAELSYPDRNCRTLCPPPQSIPAAMTRRICIVSSSHHGFALDEVQ